MNGFGMNTFGQRLDAAMRARGPVCIGIDPHPQLLTDWGLPTNVDGLARFTATCIEAFADQVAVLKPQSAFFESYGSAGLAVLESAIVAARQAGALVLLDVKRGDIGTTMAAYAAAYLEPGAPMAVDAITLSAYLGVGSLTPAFQAIEAHGTGAFVLALTSNPEGAQIQHAVSRDGRTVAQTVLDELADANAGASPFGSIGAVIGATIGPDVRIDVSKINGPLLVPGIGAQGGTAEDVRRIFAGVLAQVLPSVSREVLRHGPDRASLSAAARRQVEQFAFLRA
jgi:orotidine-5'-phosphate decarboxylase